MISIEDRKSVKIKLYNVLSRSPCFSEHEKSEMLRLCGAVEEECFSTSDSVEGYLKCINERISMYARSGGRMAGMNESNGMHTKGTHLSPSTYQSKTAQFSSRYHDAFNTVNANSNQKVTGRINGHYPSTAINGALYGTNTHRFLNVPYNYAHPSFDHAAPNQIAPNTDTGKRAEVNTNYTHKLNGMDFGPRSQGEDKYAEKHRYEGGIAVGGASGLYNASSRINYHSYGHAKQERSSSVHGTNNGSEKYGNRNNGPDSQSGDNRGVEQYSVYSDRIRSGAEIHSYGTSSRSNDKNGFAEKMLGTKSKGYQNHSKEHKNTESLKNNALFGPNGLGGTRGQCATVSSYNSTSRGAGPKGFSGSIGRNSFVSKPYAVHTDSFAANSHYNRTMSSDGAMQGHSNQIVQPRGDTINDQPNQAVQLDDIAAKHRVNQTACFDNPFPFFVENASLSNKGTAKSQFSPPQDVPTEQHQFSDGAVLFQKQSPNNLKTGKAKNKQTEKMSTEKKMTTSTALSNDVERQDETHQDAAGNAYSGRHPSTYDPLHFSSMHADIFGSDSVIKQKKENEKNCVTPGTMQDDAHRQMNDSNYHHNRQPADGMYLAGAQGTYNPVQIKNINALKRNDKIAGDMQSLNYNSAYASMDYQKYAYTNIRNAYLDVNHATYENKNYKGRTGCMNSKTDRTMPVTYSKNNGHSVAVHEELGRPVSSTNYDAVSRMSVNSEIAAPYGTGANVQGTLGMTAYPNNSAQQPRRIQQNENVEPMGNMAYIHDGLNNQSFGTGFKNATGGGTTYQDNRTNNGYAGSSVYFGSSTGAAQQYVRKNADISQKSSAAAQTMSRNQVMFHQNVSYQRQGVYPQTLHHNNYTVSNSYQNQNRDVYPNGGGLPSRTAGLAERMFHMHGTYQNGQKMGVQHSENMPRGTNTTSPWNGYNGNRQVNRMSAAATPSVYNTAGQQANRTSTVVAPDVYDMINKQAVGTSLHQSSRNKEAFRDPPFKNYPSTDVFHNNTHLNVTSGSTPRMSGNAGGMSMKQRDYLDRSTCNSVLQSTYYDAQLTNSRGTNGMNQYMNSVQAFGSEQFTSNADHMSGVRTDNAESGKNADRFVSPGGPERMANGMNSAGRFVSPGNFKRAANSTGQYTFVNKTYAAVNERDANQAANQCTSIDGTKSGPPAAQQFIDNTGVLRIRNTNEQPPRNSLKTITDSILNGAFFNTRMRTNNTSTDLNTLNGSVSGTNERKRLAATKHMGNGSVERTGANHVSPTIERTQEEMIKRIRMERTIGEGSVLGNVEMMGYPKSQRVISGKESSSVEYIKRMSGNPFYPAGANVSSRAGPYDRPINRYDNSFNPRVTEWPGNRNVNMNLCSLKELESGKILRNSSINQGRKNRLDEEDGDRVNGAANSAEHGSNADKSACSDADTNQRSDIDRSGKGEPDRVEVDTMVSNTRRDTNRNGAVCSTGRDATKNSSVNDTRGAAGRNSTGNGVSLSNVPIRNALRCGTQNNSVSIGNVPISSVPSAGNYYNGHNTYSGTGGHNGINANFYGNYQHNATEKRSRPAGDSVSNDESVLDRYRQLGIAVEQPKECNVPSYDATEEMASKRVRVEVKELSTDDMIKKLIMDIKGVKGRSELTDIVEKLKVYFDDRKAEKGGIRLIRETGTDRDGGGVLSKLGDENVCKDSNGGVNSTGAKNGTSTGTKNSTSTGAKSINHEDNGGKDALSGEHSAQTGNDLRGGKISDGEVSSNEQGLHNSTEEDDASHGTGHINFCTLNRGEDKNKFEEFMYFLKEAQSVFIAYDEKIKQDLTYRKYKEISKLVTESNSEQEIEYFREVIDHLKQSVEKTLEEHGQTTDFSYACWINNSIAKFNKRLKKDHSFCIELGKSFSKVLNL